jgi:hypothetical protein
MKKFLIPLIVIAGLAPLAGCVDPYYDGYAYGYGDRYAPYGDGYNPYYAYGGYGYGPAYGYGGGSVGFSYNRGRVSGYYNGYYR